MEPISLHGFNANLPISEGKKEIIFPKAGTKRVLHDWLAWSGQCQVARKLKWFTIHHSTPPLSFSIVFQLKWFWFFPHDLLSPFLSLFIRKRLVSSHSLHQSSLPFLLTSPFLHFSLFSSKRWACWSLVWQFLGLKLMYVNIQKLSIFMFVLLYTYILFSA